MATARKGTFAAWAQTATAETSIVVDPETVDSQKTCDADAIVKSTEEDVLREYEEKFGEVRDGRQQGYMRQCFPWASPPSQKKQTPSEAVEAALAFRNKDAGKKERTKPKLWDVDSEGEDIPICSRCSMPVGEFSYRGKLGREHCVHAECMAQIMAEDAQHDETMRVQRENTKKHKSRLEYDIGWKMDSVPKNSTIAQSLGCSPVPQGLCCLVYDEASKTVKIAATHEPAASVNLEYLLLALKVRKDRCREPLFSLDPVDFKNMEKSPQKKRYEPEWLAGTSVGDVMFQADYFLKELALGEYTMPVSGMLSVFDWSEMIDNDKEWAGREWFVVKKAEIRVAEDKTLIPHVKMGVEAREQKVTSSGLEDKAVTSPHHPLKKFADSFTRNFDIIAERKSVIFHLRELAKASVMAKFLVDSKTRLDERWLATADDIIKSTPKEAYPEIPQLWNMRGNSRIKLKDGRLVNMATGSQSSLRAIYGGVQFGLDKFELSQRSGLQGVGPGLQGAPMSHSLAPPQGMQIGPGSRQPMFMPQRFQIGQRGETPQGVDLNLDKFGLSSPDYFAGTLPPCSAPLDSREGRVTLGRAFLRKLEQNSYNLKEEDKAMLKRLFHPTVCDRTQEGDAFIPIDPNGEYITKVKNLVHEEDLLLKRRKARFSDKCFHVDNAGAEFPASWRACAQIEKDGRQDMLASDRHSLVQVQVDAAFEKMLIDDILPAAASDFQKSTEDGVVFRIYKIGSLEVRSTQEPESEQEIAAVFSRRAPSWQLSSGRKAKEASEDEAIVKAKAYIEPTEEAACHFYVVLETNASNSIVTEKRKDGSIGWAVNPDNLEDRNSLAKLLFTVDSKYGMTVRDLKNVQSKSFAPVLPAKNALSSASKSYAKAIFQLISGRGFRGKWGGTVKPWTSIQMPMRSAKSEDSDFLAGMWNARKVGRAKDAL
eukprot:TRINITY_DN4638_c0_g6_i1.p1 TRINITY_DN4638_c0_g6~~TRINITY_DN4638_c0_g6_i1.p1  ORF type:complete len:952 (-),score=197.30 TRINITY_DN4638_c0_g6_i1:126-2927(-)